MRLRARPDRNQEAIVTALRKVGVSVKVIASLGDGAPDLLCGFRGYNYLLEVKDGDLPKSRQRLTKQERRWHDLWRGDVAVVSSVHDAYEAVGIKIS